MRLYLAAFVISLAPMACGDDGSSGGGLPHETCEAVEGLAPCCDPPAADELVCPEGAERREFEDGSVRCKAGDRTVGPYVTYAGDGPIAGYGNADVGGVDTSCNAETGRMMRRGKVTDEFGRSCELECWDDEGGPITCESPCE